MKPAHAALGILLLAGAAAALAYRRAAGFDDAAAPEAADDDGSRWTDQLPSLGELIDSNQAESNERLQQMTAIINGDQNVDALLEAIARAEGTIGRGDPYRVAFGYRVTIKNLSDHPAITGEWMGEKLPDNQCKAAGFGPGCVSTAAGKYQITRTTWRKLKPRLNLRDFSPASQDAAAVELLRECGALALIQAGQFEAAVRAARRIWASLPGSGYEQPERSMAWLQDRYTEAGGMLA